MVKEPCQGYLCISYAKVSPGAPILEHEVLIIGPSFVVTVACIEGAEADSEVEAEVLSEEDSVADSEGAEDLFSLIALAGELEVVVADADRAEGIPAAEGPCLIGGGGGEGIEEAATRIPAAADCHVHDLNAGGVAVPGVPGGGDHVVCISAPVLADGDLDADVCGDGVVTGESGGVLEEEVGGDCKEGGADGVCALAYVRAICMRAYKKRLGGSRLDTICVSATEDPSGDYGGSNKRYDALK